MNASQRKRLPVLEAARESVRSARERDTVRPDLATAVVIVLDHGARAYAAGSTGSGDLRMLCQLLLGLTAALPPAEDRREVRA